MSREALTSTVARAIAQGVLPAGTPVPHDDNARPWPVLLMVALGAWLAAVPLMVMVGMLLGDLVTRSVGAYFVGGLVLTGAVVVLRSAAVPLFAEQLAVPALLVGGGVLGMGLVRDLHWTVGLVAMAALAVGVALAVPRPWLRSLLGLAAACLLVSSVESHPWRAGSLDTYWWAWQAVLAAWLVAMAVQARVWTDGATAKAAAAVDAIGAGWVLACLGGLAWWSGMTFMVGGALGGDATQAVAREVSGALSRPWWWGGPNPWMGVISVVLGVAAAALAAQRWPSLRQAWAAGVALVCVVLAWCMPNLGAVLLALVCCAVGHRWRLAGAAGAAAAWIVGAFYYQMQWPLATKAMVLVAAGAVLGAMAWWAFRTTPATSTASTASPSSPQHASGVEAGQGSGAAPQTDHITGSLAAARQSTGAHRWGIALCAALVLVVANVGIWQKQALISQGQVVLVDLAPVDPRSLMQGDFMSLNFRVPDEVQKSVDSLLTLDRPHVLAQRNAQGVLTLKGLYKGQPLAADELQIELTPKDGRWVFVTDAWYFKEGEADRWSRARYGEFRVDAKGRALLVGLRGADLKPL